MFETLLKAAFWIGNRKVSKRKTRKQSLLLFVVAEYVTVIQLYIKASSCDYWCSGHEEWEKYKNCPSLLKLSESKHSSSFCQRYKGLTHSIFSLMVTSGFWKVAVDNIISLFYYIIFVWRHCDVADTSLLFTAKLQHKLLQPGAHLAQSVERMSKMQGDPVSNLAPLSHPVYCLSNKGQKQSPPNCVVTRTGPLDGNVSFLCYSQRWLTTIQYAYLGGRCRNTSLIFACLLNTSTLVHVHKAVVVRGHSAPRRELLF